MNSSYLTEHFLIAMPALEDVNFHHTVTFVCEHNENGALGIVINRLTDISLGEVMKQMGLEWPEDEDTANQRIFWGGPVEPERGFILHQPLGDWEATIDINGVIGLTSSRDVIQALQKGEGPEQSLVALGYASWGPGQLEQEMADNAWLSGPADEDIIFKLDPEDRWQAAAQLVGVDLDRLSNDVGHA